MVRPLISAAGIPIMVKVLQNFDLASYFFDEDESVLLVSDISCREPLGKSDNKGTETADKRNGVLIQGTPPAELCQRCYRCFERIPVNLYYTDVGGGGSNSLQDKELASLYRTPPCKACCSVAWGREIVKGYFQRGVSKKYFVHLGGYLFWGKFHAISTKSRLGTIFLIRSYT
jgi:hypothetical protein